MEAVGKEWSPVLVQDISSLFSSVLYIRVLYMALVDRRFLLLKTKVARPI